LAQQRQRCIVSTVTPLDKTLKRLVKIKGNDFVVTLTPDTLRVTRKGHQRGVEMRWESLVSGESALAVALQASVGKFDLGKAEAPPAAVPASARSARRKPLKQSQKAKAKVSKSR
jgi:hypothetical protein